MKPLPLPVRIAAGLVATAVDQARDLPRLVVEFPVTAVSQALQATMRVQQKVTELAIKGDRALGTLRPVEEKPSWATFDDEEPPPLALTLRAEVEREARRLGDAMRLSVDWQAVQRLDDEMLVNAIAQVAPFDVGAKQALLEAATLDDRADLLVQLMQFQRAAVNGAEIQPTLQ